MVSDVGANSEVGAGVGRVLVGAIGQGLPSGEVIQAAQHCGLCTRLESMGENQQSNSPPGRRMHQVD